VCLSCQYGEELRAKATPTPCAAIISSPPTVTCARPKGHGQGHSPYATPAERLAAEQVAWKTDCAGARASSEAGLLAAPAGRPVAEGGQGNLNPGSSPGTGATSLAAAVQGILYEHDNDSASRPEDALRAISKAVRATPSSSATPEQTIGMLQKACALAREEANEWEARYRALANSGLRIKGWWCLVDDIFNGEEHSPRAECRLCGTPKPDAGRQQLPRSGG
jgi:hypothetical protein